MNGLKRIGRWRWRHQETVAAGVTTRTFYSPVVPREQIRHVNRIEIQNEDSNNAVVTISIYQNGTRYEFWRQTVTTAGVWYNIKAEVDVYGEEQIEYAFTSATAADDLKVREIGAVYEAIDGVF